jgi:hypothetical protein
MAEDLIREHGFLGAREWAYEVYERTQDEFWQRVAAHVNGLKATQQQTSNH